MNGQMDMNGQTYRLTNILMDGLTDRLTDGLTDGLTVGLID